jgi:hypothetical protein
MNRSGGSSLDTPDAVICPFQAYKGNGSYCLASRMEAAPVGSEYASKFCFQRHHVTCPWFRRADPEARRAVRERSSADEGAQYHVEVLPAPPSPSPRLPDGNRHRCSTTTLSTYLLLLHRSPAYRISPIHTHR